MWKIECRFFNFWMKLRNCLFLIFMKSICFNKHITQQWALVALFGVRFFVLVSLATHCSTSTNLKQRLLMLAQRSTHVPSLAPLLPPHSLFSLSPFPFLSLPNSWTQQLGILPFNRRKNSWRNTFRRLGKLSSLRKCFFNRTLFFKKEEKEEEK